MTPADPRLQTVVFDLPAGILQAQAEALARAWSHPEIVSWSAERQERDADVRWRISWIVPSGFDKSQILASLCLAATLSGNDAVLPDLSCISIAPVPDIDWLAHVHRMNPPFAVGRFFVYGSHCTGDTPPDLIPLAIDAATAFGSGTHETTAGCLEALGQIADAGFVPRQILDMGTGSGILAIGAWKLWRCTVLAVDIEREAVRVACLHRARNQVPAGAGGVVCAQGGRFSISAIVSRAPFDLVLANILAAPLKSMCRDLFQSTASGGFAVLSGMLSEQAGDVACAYEQTGMRVFGQIDRGVWTTLLLRRP